VRRLFSQPRGAAAGDPAAAPQRRVRALAIVAALVVRIAWGIAVPVEPISDSAVYDTLAQNIAAGIGYSWHPGEPTAYWAVGTSAVYAFLYSIFGHAYAPIVAVNILLGALVVALAGSLARRWLGEEVGGLAAWILALWPAMIEYTTLLASELLFIAFVLVALWLAAIPSWKPLARSLAAGLAFAAACYVRPIVLLFVPIAFLGEAVSRKKLSRMLAASAIAYLALLAAVLPWSLRNDRVFGRFVLVSTNAGANFWMGNNPETTGSYMEPPRLGILNEAERDRELKRQAWAYIVEKPLPFVARTIGKALSLHDRETIGVVWNEGGLRRRAGAGVVLPLKLLSSAYWYLALIAAALGIALLFRNRGFVGAIVAPPLLAWLYFAAMHSVTVVGDRYHVPSIPFVAMLAAYAVFEARRRLIVRRTAR
jgi:4-amino-4-deoxy-L-arabinose transferase-like glycosyltransferase